MSKLKVAQFCFRELLSLSLVMCCVYEFFHNNLERAYFWILLAIFLELTKMNVMLSSKKGDLE